MPSQKGFTLIEVMIATLLLTVALLGLAAVTSTVIRGNSFSQTLTLATTLAKDKMEETKSITYNNLNAGTTTDYANSDGSKAGGPTGSFYTRTLTIGAEASNMRQVSVTVTWNWLNLGHTVTLNTLRAKRN